MPADVTVTTDPLLVFGMVGLLVGALVLALIFARPRRGLGAVEHPGAPDDPPRGEPWMPGGDIFDHDQPAPPGAAGRQPTEPTPAAPAVPDAWSTGAGGGAGGPSPWERR